MTRNADSWGALNLEGAAEASEIIARAREEGCPLAIWQAVRAMIEKGTIDGRDCGFVFRLAEAVITGS